MDMFTSIASYANEASTMRTQTQMSVSMLAKSQEQTRDTGEQVVDMIDAAGEVSKPRNPEGTGSRIDVTG